MEKVEEKQVTRKHKRLSSDWNIRPYLAMGLTFFIVFCCCILVAFYFDLMISSQDLACWEVLRSLF